MYQPTGKDVESAIKLSIESLKENTFNAEIAFFGGSFTAIDREYMISLLDATTPYIDRFKGIRISTRPDCIDDEILTLLKKYKVTAIELGAQSMDDAVLTLNNRGHNSICVEKAVAMIKSYDISVGLQMMTGLYGSSVPKDIYTALRFISLKPDTVRIYPTVIMKDTYLEKLYQSGEYQPYSFEETIGLCADLLSLFVDNGVSVIRLGLHHSESLEQNMIAGAYHPAFRELCESRIMLKKALKLLQINNTDKEYTLLVSPSCVSKMIGNKRSNIIRLNELGYKVKIVQSDDVAYMDVALEK